MKIMNTHQTKQFLLGWNMGIEKANQSQIETNLILIQAGLILTIIAVVGCYLMVKAEARR